jgi:predicted DNA-binding antitoxin AbrB/MazE fold protein
MVLKLTYNATGASTLINMSDFKTAYRVTDPKGVFEPSTKVEFRDGTFINVREDLQTLLKLIQDYNEGIYQQTEWVDEEIQPVKKRFEQAFNRDRRERTWNTPHAFNENRF